MSFRVCSAAIFTCYFFEIRGSNIARERITVKWCSCCRNFVTNSEVTLQARTCISAIGSIRNTLHIDTDSSMNPDKS